MTRGRYLNSSVAPHAGLLLLILLTQLTFMTLPFHLAMVEGSQDSPGAMPAGGTGMAHEYISLDDQPHADCAIRWATSPQALRPALLMAGSVLGWGIGCPASTPITRPLAQAHGPPHADRQALLQVFRL